MSAVINISYAHSTICRCFYCIHISFFIITLQRYVLFPTPPNFSPFFSSAINNHSSTINHHSPPLCAPAPSAHKHSHIVRQTLATLLRHIIATLLRRHSRATPTGREL